MYVEQRNLHRRHIPNAANWPTQVANSTETGRGEVSHPPSNTGQTHPLALGLIAFCHNHF